ncbi:MAG: hypothetical protein ACO1HP_07485 [Bacteroidota bacterium]
MMKKLLLSTYVQTLWALFIQNNTALGIDILNGTPNEKAMKDTITELWIANENAGVLEKDLPAATLQNLYELAHGDDADALVSIQSTL